ncbi:zinc ribbon domain-containing protein [Streptomyces sp. NPDC019443]|uniref:zinc ribbon domain-containing protein n=1 Tax=Streptomyces sp. NPDC019443 TaxID=3365061 RepID=UPI0037B474BA
MRRRLRREESTPAPATRSVAASPICTGTERPPPLPQWGRARRTSVLEVAESRVDIRDSCICVTAGSRVGSHEAGGAGEAAAVARAGGGAGGEPARLQPSRHVCKHLAYKARRAGVPFLEVDAAYTSQRCPRCGHTEKANRPARDHFSCRRCGLAGPADVVAGVNVGDRARSAWAFVTMPVPAPT